MMIFLVLFTAFGIVLMIGGLRSRPVPCEAVCAGCGYDLRGHAVLTRCSECGRDLKIAGAVRRHKLTANRQRIVIGICIIALPWGLIALSVLRNLAGPNWERVRSNDSLITEIDSQGNFGPFGPWLWDELARRLTVGTLKNPQATRAVDQFILYLQRPNRGGVLAWAQSFYTAADRAGVITPAQYLQIAQSYYPKVEIKLPFGVNEDSRSQLNVFTGFGSDFPGLHRVITIQQISISGTGATTQDILHRPGQGSMPPPDINLLMPNLYTVAAAHVPEGEYQLKTVVQITIMPGTGTTTVAAAPAPTIPTPLAQWTETTTAPVQVIRDAYARTSPPAFRLRTDPAADPKATGALSLASAEVLCYEDATIVSIRLKVAHVPVWCRFIPKVTIAGQSFTTGSQALWPELPVFETLEGCELGPIPKDVTTADLDLVPDIELARQSQIPQIWGKTISFKNIQLRRRECNFNLKQWRQDHPNGRSRATSRASSASIPSP